MQNFKKKKVIVITVLAVMLVVLAICGIHKIVKVWKYKSCNTKYISIKQYDNLEIPKVKPEKVKRLSTVLTQNMGLFFVPAGVGLMNSFGIISEYWAVLLIASVVSTILVIASVALVQQKLEKGK